MATSGINFQDVSRELSSSMYQFVARYDASKDPCDQDFLIFKLHQFYRILCASNIDDNVLESISRSLSLLQDMQMGQPEVNNYSPEVVCGGHGRPKFHISFEQLEHLLKIGLNCSTIASLLGVSLRTIRRRMSDFGLSVRERYTDLEDSQLDFIVEGIKYYFPNCGYRMLRGHLRGRDIFITQQRVRESLNRVDPCGSAIRWATSIQRRRYHVEGPLSLWHMMEIINS